LQVIDVRETKSERQPVHEYHHSHESPEKIFGDYTPSVTPSASSGRQWTKRTDYPEKKWRRRGESDLLCGRAPASTANEINLSEEQSAVTAMAHTFHLEIPGT
jgi:hypothetical protein